jgi:hypothetical protein
LLKTLQHHEEVARWLHLARNGESSFSDQHNKLEERVDRAAGNLWSFYDNQKRAATSSEFRLLVEQREAAAQKARGIL